MVLPSVCSLTLLTTTLRPHAGTQSIEGDTVKQVELICLRIERGVLIRSGGYSVFLDSRSGYSELVVYGVLLLSNASASACWTPPYTFS